MPVRKPHSKSRKGCMECKRRHTKCNEQHPRCSTCSRLGIDCTWVNWQPANALTASKSESVSVTGSPSPVPPTPVAPQSEDSPPGLISNFKNVSRPAPTYPGPAPRDLAVDDLRLLHHFTTRTYATLDTAISQQDIWRESVIQVGFEYPFLLRGVLAISALHLATIERDKSVEYLVQATNQHSLALVDFRNVLLDVNEQNCVAMFAFSCITVIHAFAVAQIHQSKDPISDFLNCLRLVQGVAVVLHPFFFTVEASPLSPILGYGPKFDMRGEIPEILQLKKLINSVQSSDTAETIKAYLYAIDLLHTVALEAQHLGTTKSHLSLVFSWPALLSASFLNAVAVQEPVSLIIMAYFVGVLHRKRSFWWISSSNMSIIDDIQTKLAPELVELLEWPRMICRETIE